MPGAERSDLWNSLWSLWAFPRILASPGGPLHTELLGFPRGGTLLVADPLNALLVLPLLPLLGPATAYGLLVLGHLVFAGWAGHRLAERLVPLPGAGWIAGLAYQLSPVLVSEIHNGTSESVAAGWLPLALLAGLEAAERGGLRRVLLAGLALGLALLSSWYAGLCALLGLSGLLLLGRPGIGLRLRLRRLLPVLALGSALAAPLALLALSAARAPDSLVGIKHPEELASVRRSTGAADPLGWFAPGDFRSPDFERSSRYGEQFVHAHYLGWTLLLGSALALAAPRRRRGLGWLALAGGLAAVLAMGPVVVRDGHPLIVSGLALPLPYLLLERLPGFSALSLLYRLAFLPSLAVAVLGAAGLAARGPRPLLGSALAALLVVGELRLLSPARHLPALSDASPHPALLELSRAPEGGAMDFPVVGGRRYLYEQVFHRKPLCGSLNFPNGRASMRLWREVLEHGREAREEPAAFRERISAVACSLGVRYLLAHSDPWAMPDQHDQAVSAIRAAFEPRWGDRRLRVYDFCDRGSGDPPGGGEEER